MENDINKIKEDIEHIICSNNEHSNLIIDINSYPDDIIEIIIKSNDFFKIKPIVKYLKNNKFYIKKSTLPENGSIESVTNYIITGTFHKNLLIVGNGFDIGHDLKTKYSNFLDNINILNEILHCASSDDSIKPTIKYNGENIIDIIAIINKYTANGNITDKIDIDAIIDIVNTINKDYKNKNKIDKVAIVNIINKYINDKNKVDILAIVNKYIVEAFNNTFDIIFNSLAKDLDDKFALQDFCTEFAKKKNTINYLTGERTHNVASNVNAFKTKYKDISTEDKHLLSLAEIILSPILCNINSSRYSYNSNTSNIITTLTKTNDMKIKWFLAEHFIKENTLLQYF